MFAGSFIDEDLPPLKMGDRVRTALRWMDDFKISHLSIVGNSGDCLGVLSEDELLNASQDDISIAEAKIELLMVSVFENDHVFEVIKKMSAACLSCIPVLNAENKYMGSISNSKLIDVVASISMIEAPGGLLELEMNSVDYSLTEISRIVESSNAKILGSYITAVPDSTSLKVTIKLNTNNLEVIIASFERFNYTISAKFHQDSGSQDIMDRYGSLMNYLNI